MKYSQPKHVLAGFYAEQPDDRVPELVHAGEQWVPTHFLIRYHAHDVWEFYFQISGETSWESPERTYRLASGSFLAVPPNVYHKMHEYPKAKHHFFFAAIDLTTVFARHPELKALGRENAIVYIPHGESLFAPFSQLIREVSLSLSHRAIGLRLMLDFLVVEASRLFEQATNTTALVGSHPAVLRAKELLDHQPCRRWRLADLANISGLSPSHLAERFSKDVGMPPHQYLLQVRVERAKELLLQSNVRITDLALELGFSSSQHFASTFKRLTGTTARSYRNESGR